MITENKELKKLNTLGLKAKARWFAQPADVASIKRVLSDTRFKGMPILVTGSGSNLLYSKDFNGLLIRPDITSITVTGEDKNSVYLRAGAGVNWDTFVAYCVDRGWGGVENLIANRNQSDQDARGGLPRPPAFGTAPVTEPPSSNVGYNSLRDHSIFLFPQK